MLRRRLRLTCSDDDEEETSDQHQPQIRDQPTFTHHQTPQNPTPNPSEPLEISDEDFIDVSDNLSPPSPTLPPPPVSVESSDCPIRDCLGRLGLRLRREWFDSCVGGLQSSVPGFARLDASGKAKLCFQQFLFSDMNFSGGGALPDDVGSLHLVDLAGPFVLQVDEVVNISAPLRGRYQNASCGVKRCLKLSMTDGVHRVFGMEYRPIKALEVFSPAGLKVAICNVHIRHGLMMLVPEAVEVLGGSVEELEAARQRLVEEVNKPPRGKRTRSGEVPSLATRATLAAWPPNVSSVPGNNNSSTSQNANYSGPNGSSASQRANYSVPNVSSASQRANYSVPNVNSASQRANYSVPNVSSASQSANYSVPNVSSASQSANYSVPNVSSASESANHSVPNVSSASQSANYSMPNVRVTFGTGTTRRTTEEFNGRTFRESSTHNLSSNDAMDVEDIYMNAVSVDAEDTRPNPSSDSSHNISSNNILDVEDTHMKTVPVINEPSGVVTDDEDIQIVDQVEHLHILSGDRENPFTYLASLSGKWATVKERALNVKGKIKCFLTGIKAFQFKQKKTYELQVYVDDGSLISHILIDHNVVQRRIGHSSEEVTAALSSSDSRTVANMKEKLKQFQIFLTNFEGTMVVEINGSSPLPIAREMNEGCSVSDAWLLLRRLKSLTLAPPPQGLHFDPIDISP